MVMDGAVESWEPACRVALKGDGCCRDLFIRVCMCWPGCSCGDGSVFRKAAGERDFVGMVGWRPVDGLIE